MLRFPVLLAALLLFLLPACASKKLSKRVPGTWYIDHYSEWTRDTNTGHTLDGAGYVSLYKNGKGELRLKDNMPHGTLGRAGANFNWNLQDSLVSITAPNGRLVAEWLITSGYDTYMEWVSVNAGRDSVRTMYLRK